VQAKAAVAQAEAQLQAEDPSVSIAETSNTAAVAGASSDLASASAGLSGSQSDVEQLTARLAQAQGNARLAQIERQRGEELWKAQAIPKADLDRRVTTAETAAAEVQATRQALASARQKVSQLQAQLGATKSRLTEVRKNAPREVETRRASVLYRQANLDLAKAQLAQAELNLGYAQIRAPIVGVVAKKAVSVGDHVAPGQQLIAIAGTDVLWVTANFRETQLELMQPGQPVDIHVDALALNLSGKVESLGGTTGSRLSVLPPENASGNYVKVVQRIPVRIRIDPGQAGIDRLRPGMSVEPKVRIRP
jgi:membrane fusion protein (multidrug efflux system)